MAEVDKIRIVNLGQIRFCVLAIVLGCSAGADGQGEAVRRDPERVESCSMINLIATPEKYDGKRIETWGVVRIEFEGNAIYISSESAEHRAKVNGIYLALEDSGIPETSRARLDRRWVHVVGVYHKPEPESVDWRGHIDGITHLYSREDVEIE